MSLLHEVRLQGLSHLFMDIDTRDTLFKICDCSNDKQEGHVDTDKSIKNVSD